MRPTMLAARSLRKASIPPTLLSDPTPGSLQPTRLAVHVNGAGSSCSAYLASGCRVYKIEISMDGVMLSKGKESLLIPDNAQVISSSVVDRCPHQSEIQSVAFAEGEGDNCLILGTVDSYGHLIVSRLDIVADGTLLSCLQHGVNRIDMMKTHPDDGVFSSAKKRTCCVAIYSPF
uniref:Cleavage/polyadenylation specificity factor A subunit N-terminal domain-containing protein n=1 Tax=Arundo donax TaxID=35708 RepID=A0A0A9G623_ARUDO